MTFQVQHLASPPSMSLFWRTFLMLILLIWASVLGGLQAYWVFADAPAARGIAQQIISMTNLTRYAMVTADPVYRPDLIRALAGQENLGILPREVDDSVTPLKETSTKGMIAEMVRESLGPDTVLAERVNGVEGLWVSTSIRGDGYWIMIRKEIFDRPSGTSWLWWAILTFVLSIIGATLLTRYTVEPLANLSRAAKALGRGDVPPQLPDTGVAEIREVNRSFNLMVSDLAHSDEDRELLLAGVSHDLRTPITRLRLEVELASLPEDSRDAMIQDLQQMENIVNQFLDYARRNRAALETVDLSEVTEEAVSASRMSEDPDISIDCSIRPNVMVRGRAGELGRIVQNLLVNASRYGRSDDGRLEVSVKVALSGGEALLAVSDHGHGLSESEMKRVIRPFERGEKARTGSTGSGLGLAIVDRIVRRSGGAVKLSANKPTGLMIEVRLPLAEKENK